MAVIAVTKDSFQALIQESEQPVLLDFWASWCAPCRMLSPVLEELAQEDEGLTVGKINVDEEPELAAKFGIVSIPTLVLMRGGKVLAQDAGYRPKAALEQWLNRYI